MGIFKKLTKGLKEKIVDPFKGFVNRNKKALITAAILGATIYTGGALAGWWGTGAATLAPSASALATIVPGSAATSTLAAAGAAGGVGATTVASSVATGAATKAAGLAEAKVTTGQDPFRKPEPEIRGQLQPLAVEGQTMSRNLEFGFGSYLG
jgi:predicted negative regulator of RcsB-dependent stress response